MSTALEGSSAPERGAGACGGCGCLEGSAMRASIRPRPRYEAPVAPGSAGRARTPGRARKPRSRDVL